MLFMYRAGNDVQGLTFTRSLATGTYVDADGVIKTAAANEFRTTFVDAMGTVFDAIVDPPLGVALQAPPRRQAD